MSNELTIGRVSTLSADTARILSLLWPEALAFHEREGWHPPMDDHEVEKNLGGLPDWIVDKYSVLHRLMPGHVGLDDPPTEFPTVEKPRRNPGGLAAGARMHHWQQPKLPKGYLWQRQWTGRHFSIDIGIVRGWRSWQIVAEGIPAVGPDRFGEFVAWTVYPTSPPAAEKFNVREIIVQLRLHEFTGVLNIETIEDQEDGQLQVVEIHCRPSRCFGPLYGPDVRMAILAHAAGMKPDGLPHIPGGTMIPRPMKPPFLTATDITLGEDPGWRMGVEYYE